MSETTTKLIRVTGRVQGVFFRGWTKETAEALGLRGWARNRADGSVEILASGPGEAVASLIESCRKGPPSARVENVRTEDSDEAASAAFEVRPTV